MKKTLLGFCLLVGMSAVALQANAQRLGVPLEDSASRWSSSVMERHAPMDSAQLQKLGQKKFRYMDMAQIKRSKSIRNAVIIHGLDDARQNGVSQQQVYRRNFPSGHPIVIMRPMT
ncbi:hypothetical protein ACIPEN_20835 [Herbaspirillum chlorophenolicum]|uniref:Uncharacterized protein n=1 Tax=Herbaspirillum chlorophenolicum TaxID=211589 RepID=A0ABW8F4R0_9BURK